MWRSRRDSNLRYPSYGLADSQLPNSVVMLSSVSIAAREQFANIDAKRIGYRDDRLDTGIFLAAFDAGQVPQRQFCLSRQRLL